MPIQVSNEKRKYTRLAHTPAESVFLQQQGLRPVVSSNVSAVGVRGNDLIVRFHGGATYAYPGLSGRVDDILSAPSKGKWVWRELRQSGVAYQKTTDVDMAGDVEDKSLRDLMREDAEAPFEILSTLVRTEDLITLGIMADFQTALLINALGG